MDQLLRETLSTKQTVEIAFIHTPKQRIHPDIFAARFDTAEVSPEGVTYSFDRPKLYACFRKPITSLATIAWHLSVPPYAERQIFSVMTPSDPAHAEQDHVVTAYVPDQAASTTGMMVVHFFSEEEATAFARYVGH